MIVKLSQFLEQSNGLKITIRCPACGHYGTFENVRVNDLYDTHNTVYFGSRKCPKPYCDTHIFFIYFPSGEIITYPPETIDFDKTGIPERVLTALRRLSSVIQFNVTLLLRL
jgi:hypothetical protein